MLRSPWFWLILFCTTFVTIQNTLRQNFTLDIGGALVGPVWVASGIAFDPAEPGAPAEIIVPTEGEAQKTFFWRNPAALAERGPIRVNSHWSTTAQPTWLRSASICDFVEARYAAADHLKASTPITAMPSSNVTTCQFMDIDDIHWLYMTRVHLPRCDRQGLTISRLRYIDGVEDDPDGPLLLEKSMYDGAIRGFRTSLAQSLSSISTLLPSPDCTRRTTQLGVTTLILLVAGSGLTLLLLRDVHRRSICVPVHDAPANAPLRDAPPMFASDPRRSVRLLIVDEREQVRKQLIRDLSSTEVEVRGYFAFEDLLDELTAEPRARILITLTRESVESQLSQIREKAPYARVVGVMHSPTPGLLRRAERANVTMLLDESTCNLTTIRAALFD